MHSKANSEMFVLWEALVGKKVVQFTRFYGEESFPASFLFVPSVGIIRH